MNQIFGYQILPGDDPYNTITFEGTQSIFPSANFNSASPQIRFFAQPHTNLQICYSDKYKAYSYVWGIPVHPEIAAKDIPEWSANILADKRYDCFKELLGLMDTKSPLYDV